MIVTTTRVLEDRRIVADLGLVSGEAIMSANLFRDFLASVRDVVGGQSEAYETVLKNARDAALEEMEAEARVRGATAIVGVDLDYEVISKKGSMLMVAASGTAVHTEGSP